MKGIQIIVLLMFIYFCAWYLATDIRTLGENGWVMYHSPDCGYCVKQLQDIGWKSFFLPKVDCKANPTVCEKEGIGAFPTWKNSITNQIHMGSVPMENLFTTLSSADVVKNIKVNVKSTDTQSITSG